MITLKKNFALKKIRKSDKENWIGKTKNKKKYGQSQHLVKIIKKFKDNKKKITSKNVCETFIEKNQ